ncbi:hypothetical protein D9613_002755 [Agrocybe pediades]|uniref:Uncharacterized protein n=1 Tax=Agrocybe pediades TaxID=84607 RepID=A0A8H4VPI3_9AGAR|nr:hypothetical protein D9613_002755 [Agrocybe pediades]
MRLNFGRLDTSTQLAGPLWILQYFDYVQNILPVQYHNILPRQCMQHMPGAELHLVGCCYFGTKERRANEPSWSEWSDECDGQATLYEYKEPIPTGLDVPSWAYLDVTTKNYFDLNAAFKNATASKNLLASNNPSSTQSESFVTPTPVPPSTNSNSNTPISNIIYNNVTMPDSDSKKDDSKVDIPALIGALTGAISGLVLATLAVLKYRAFRRNRAQKVKDADTEQLDLVDGPEPEDEWEKEDSDDEQGHEYTITKKAHCLEDNISSLQPYMGHNPAKPIKATGSCMCILHT